MIRQEPDGIRRLRQEPEPNVALIIYIIASSQRGIVEKREDYLYSSARNYANLESMIDVYLVDFLWKTVK